ncbi:hypothetical protein [Enterococcus wangshanyuanii]|uniref:Phage protein n=1 Tax=Enterococcus wangshanyuanii TaxID=2005703 RepID=A0ABQ1PWR4_9ENTE|nr:hypothetical protein [Enterococcus wangshanyuanii]GGD05594.1 hypothetical protein GCM10011573_38780 [Enterococcus wangshanyuanii]
MYSQNELLKKLKQDSFKIVQEKYTAKDVNERFGSLYCQTSGFSNLMARVKMDGLTDYHFEDYSEYEDIFVEQIANEVLALLKKVPSKTVEEYLTEVKKEVFKGVRGKTDIEDSDFDNWYYGCENYKLMEKSVKQRADAEGVIRSDDFEIVLAGDVTAIIEELV